LGIIPSKFADVPVAQAPLGMVDVGAGLELIVRNRRLNRIVGALTNRAVQEMGASAGSTTSSATMTPSAIRMILRQRRATDSSCVTITIVCPSALS
jgi:hypothetical protein